jgi:hypothetical protein
MNRHPGVGSVVDSLLIKVASLSSSEFKPWNPFYVINIPVEECPNFPDQNATEIDSVT